MENAASYTVVKIKTVNVLMQALKLPCPCCGSTNLSKNLWSLNGGEVDAVECNDCCAGAPAESWIVRK